MTPSPLLAHWRIKLLLATLLGALVCVPYYVLQHFPFSAPHVMSESELDRLVPFSERWIWIYVTLYPLLLVAPLLSRSRLAIRRYAIGFAIVCAVSHAIFLVMPTAIAPLASPPSDPVMRLVLLVDGQINACPSLHASLAIYTALWGPRLLGALRGERVVTALLWVWTAAVLYSTVAARRHVVADLVAGGALALLTFAYAARLNARAVSVEAAAVAVEGD